MYNYFNQIFCEINTRYSVVIENDGVVAYAYLLDNANIIGDVWLYNQAATPKTVDWTIKENMPFINSLEFINGENEALPLSEYEDIKLEWVFLNDNTLLNHVTIFFREKLVVVMKPSSKPGWSSKVKKNGPLAKMLIISRNNASPAPVRV